MVQVARVALTCALALLALGVATSSAVAQTVPPEADPAPVASTATVTYAAPYGCALNTAVEVRPELVPARLFPFGDLQLTIRGRSGAAQGIARSRTIAGDGAHLFERLAPGRYDVSATYLGDPFRLRSATAQRSAVLAPKRCDVYFTGTGSRRVRPRVALTLSRKRVCRGYDEYLSLRYRPLQGRIPRAAKLDFSSRC